MMAKKPQKTDLQQEDHHPRAYRSDVEKEKGKERQTASACVAKKAISRRIAPTSGTCRRPNPVELLVEHLAVCRRVKQKVKSRTKAMEAKAMGKSKDQFFFKSQGKSVCALEYPDQEPYWSEGSWSAEDGAWNPIGAVSQVKTRCNISGVPCPVVPAETVPIRIMHKKNTAVEGQPMSKMHTIAEDTDEVEKDETNMEKEKKEVENMFAEKRLDRQHEQETHEKVGK